MYEECHHLFSSMRHLLIVSTGLLNVSGYLKLHEIKDILLEADACVDQILSTEDQMIKSDFIKRFDGFSFSHII